MILLVALLLMAQNNITAQIQTLEHFDYYNSIQLTQHIKQLEQRITLLQDQVSLLQQDILELMSSNPSILH